MFGGTNNIMWNNFHIQINVMDLNKVMMVNCNGGWS